MAALHTALKTLAPIKWSDFPTDEAGLQSWISDLFTQSQLILDSIPIAEASEPSDGARNSSSSVASNASEISLSSARPPPPAPDHQALQKEWGKAVKLGAKENALGMSVYKLSGKDGRGAWFARRSVHEGLSFSKFKKALEMEFPESLAVQGAPGEGNVRGIGGETKVEDVKIPGKGRVEVYRLSAQFPGPTTPRDFVTMLVTSESAMEPVNNGDPVPRHYMIVSKPCDHPDAQPQSGFIRGFYESVEFIREIPVKLKAGSSTTDLPQLPTHTEDIGRDAMIRNAQQKTKSFPIEESTDEKQDSTRKRSSTEPAKPPTLSDTNNSNPVEWIMVTRSDPGGSVPRFMVERGTPGSICADAEKFLNWACQQEFGDEEVAKAKDLHSPASATRRDSFQSFRSSRMAGIHDETEASETTGAAAQKPDAVQELSENQTPPTGIIGTVSGYLSSYTPQVVLDHLPGSHATGAQSAEQTKEHTSPPEREDDAASIASFESADSHLTTSESEPVSPASSRVGMPRKSEEHLTHHEKELRKLEQRKTALQNKFSESRSKLEKEDAAQNAKDENAKRKAIEKHEKELKKHQEKYEREMKKIEEKKEKERKKAEEKQKKQADKDEKARLTRERDEARQELELQRKEAEVLRGLVEDLQRENTNLVAKLGKAGLIDGPAGDDSRTPSRHSSKKGKGHVNTGSPSTSIKSQ